MDAINRVLKEQRYVYCLFCWGVLPLLKLLEEYEQDCNYEECQIILNALNYINTHIDEEKLPTRYSEEAIKDVKNEFEKWGIAENKALDNVDEYIREIKKFVK